VTQTTEQETGAKGPASGAPPQSDPATAAAAGWRWSGRIVLVVLVVFFLVRLPVATEYFIYHYDEHFYTDGALDMLRDGSYFSPREANGVPRFNKPPLTYWVIAGSFHLLGIAPWVARLPFLLMALGVIWLAWRLARSMLEDGTEALLVPLFLISNCRFNSIIVFFLYIFDNSLGNIRRPKNSNCNRLFVVKKYPQSRHNIIG